MLARWHREMSVHKSLFILPRNGWKWHACQMAARLGEWRWNHIWSRRRRKRKRRKRRKRRGDRSWRDWNSWGCQTAIYSLSLSAKVGFKTYFLRLKEDGRAVCPSPFIRNDYMFEFLQCFLFSCRRNRAHSLVAPFGASEPIKSKKISHYRMVIPTLAIICLFFQLQPLVWGALVSKFGGNYDEMTHFCWCTIFTIESLHLKNQYQR